MDTNGDSLISYDEARAVIALNVGGTSETPGEIAEMKGIEAFSNLDSLICADNVLNDLDVSHNHNIADLNLCVNPDLEQVCVWTVPFPTAGVVVCTEESPNVYFTAECDN